MHPTRRDVMLGALAAGVWPVQAAAGALVHESGAAFGSRWRVVHGAADPVAPTVRDIVGEVDRAMSPYLERSDLSRVNRGGAGRWHAVPSTLSDVAGAALAIAAETGGTFDPTVGPVVSRLGFGPIRGQAGPYSGIEVRADAIRKSGAGLTLDLCGIAKGYALDRIVAALRGQGVDSALIELGGEVRAIGDHPDGRPWRVAIADPRGTGQAWRVIGPGDLALATSGHAAQGVTGPVGISHIVDPARGRAAETSLLSVSVLAPTAMRADALATAFAAAGPERGVALARRLGTSALFILEGRTDPTEVLTGAFRDHLRGEGTSWKH